MSRKPNKQGGRVAEAGRQERSGSLSPRPSTAEKSSGEPASSVALDPGIPAGPHVPGRRFREPARLVGAQAKIRTRLPVALLTLLSLGLSCLIFPPVGWWWLSYICLVPWLFCICTGGRSWFVYFMSLLFGLGFYLVHIRWMIPVTPPGYVALCIGYSIFFPLAAWPIRHMYRRHGVSVALSAPIAWVATEYLRSIGPLGFPFILLGHSHYKILTMIQISDLVGAYGVSFVLAMVNGWITDLLIQPILIWHSDRATRLPVGSLTTLVVVLGTIIYGSAQRSSDFFRPGPKVAVIQHDFPMYVDHHPGAASSQSIFDSYLALATKAAEQKPDLIVLPETAMSSFVNNEFLDASPADLEQMRLHRWGQKYSQEEVANFRESSRLIRNAFQDLSTRTGVPIILGSSSLEWKPTEIPPRAEGFNSAFLLKPGETKPVARYDKIHLVLFGEYVPFRYTYQSIYEWLNSMTPWGREGGEYSLTEGREFNAFEFNAASQNGRSYRAGVPICYEEVMPYIARQFVRGSGELRNKKNIDMLLTISNDGWFLHTAELDQHLAAAVFRAVENRIPIARSVNTGASAQIHPNGGIHSQVMLSDRDAKLLEPVSALLRKMDGLMDGLAKASDDEQYIKTLQEFYQVFSKDYRETIQALGPEYAYLYQEPAPLLGRLAAKSVKQRMEAADWFRGQIQDDLDTIARWKEKPWTAPGFIIADMKCDDRVTFYTRSGDWFAQGTVGLVGLMLLDWLLRRVLRKRPAGDKATEGDAE